MGEGGIWERGEMGEGEKWKREVKGIGMYMEEVAICKREINRRRYIEK